MRRGSEAHDSVAPFSLLRFSLSALEGTVQLESMAPGRRSGVVRVVLAKQVLTSSM